MPHPSTSCPSCGAGNPADAARCDLCGTPLGAAREEQPEEVVPPPQEPAPAAPAADDGVFCHQCGWQSPSGARFCSRCGTKLQDVRGASAGVTKPAPPLAASAQVPAEDRPAARRARSSAGVGRQVFVILGAALLLVVALFLISAMSEETVPAASLSPGEAQVAQAQTEAADASIEEHLAHPLPAALADTVVVMEDEIAGLEGAERIERQRGLVAFLAQNGRFGRAADLQRTLAEATGTADDWSRTGNLFYDWMDTTPSGALRRTIADEAASAYEQALEQQPGNLDVRTDLATVYLEGSQPMRGVEMVKAVLEEDPDHLKARFNYGIMLLRINRLDEAAEQFRRVQLLTAEDSQPYEQAQEFLQIIQNQQGGAAAG